MARKEDRVLPEVISVDQYFSGNIQLSALYEEGGKKIMRIYESAGKESTVSIELPFGN